MNDQELTGNEKLKEIEYAERLVNENKFTEAYQLLTELGKNETIPPYHRILGLLLQCQILMWQGKYNDYYKLAEQIYKESLGLEKDLRTVEALSMMALSSILLRKFNKGIELVQQAENLLKTFPQETIPEYYWVKALIAQNKGYYYLWSLENIEEGLKYLEESLSWRKRYGGKVEIAMGFRGVGEVFSTYKGELDHAIEYLKQGLTFAIESGNKWPVIMILNQLGETYSLKGELDRAIEYNKNGLEVAKEINNITYIISFLNQIGNLYMNKGELDLASDYLGQIMAMSKESGKRNWHLLVSLFLLSLFNNDRKMAQQYVQRLEKLSVQVKDKSADLWLLLYNAWLLKASPRFRNKIRAEEKLRQILEEENLPYRLEVYTLIHLSDLLITELRVTNEEEIIQEIKPLITRLLEVAENSNSYWDLCEVYLLQAKLALIQMNIEEAKLLLTKAQNIAESHDLNRLSIQISYEHDKLLEQASEWNNLKKKKAPISDRMGLVSLEETIDIMLQKRGIQPPELTDEMPVLLLVIEEGGIPLFSHTFSQELSFEEDIISNFLSAFNSFSEELFSKGLDRAKFGEYILIMDSIGSLSVCYLFKGQSYLAKQKLMQFAHRVQNITSIWQIFENYRKTHQAITLSEIPPLQSLITEIFIDKIK